MFKLFCQLTTIKIKVSIKNKWEKTWFPSLSVLSSGPRFFPFSIVFFTYNQVDTPSEVVHLQSMNESVS